MSSTLRNVLLTVGGAIAMAAIFKFVLWPMWWTPPGKDAAKPTTQLAAKGADANAPTTRAATQPATRPGHDTIPSLPKLEAQAARRAFVEGKKLLDAKRFGEGREELSAALLSDKLTPAEEVEARRILTDLGEKMILSQQVYDDDAYVQQYTVQGGDVLNRIERRLALRVPTQLTMKINGIADAGKIRPGQTLKLIKGPFHAVVTKSKFILDLYLYSEGRQPVFVKQLRIGLGKNGSTPAGMWRVALGKKFNHAVWYPPPGSEELRSINWGQPGYPLGTEGYWISLEGADERTSRHSGYGIHGTNEPQTIGKEASLGCIRLADPDIATVFMMLYEKHSTVEIRP